MSLVNPVPTPGHAPGTPEKRAYEPSMEDILASIRRIIADDQSIPKPPSADDGASEHRRPDDLLQPIMPPTTSAEPTPFPGPRPIPRPTPDSPAHEALEAPLPAASGDVPAPSAQEPTTHEAAPSVAPQEPVVASPFPTPHGPAGDEPLADAISSPVPPIPSTTLGAGLHDTTSGAFGRYERAPTPTLADDAALYATPIEPTRSHRAEKPAPELFSAETDSTVSSAFNVLAASRLASNSDDLMNLARDMIRPLLRAWLDDNLPSMVERMVRAEIERVSRGGR